MKENETALISALRLTWSKVSRKNVLLRSGRILLPADVAELKENAKDFDLPTELAAARKALEL